MNYFIRLHLPSQKTLQNVDISIMEYEYSTSTDPLEIRNKEELINAIEEYHIENTCT
jgi:hypothetical protein